MEDDVDTNILQVADDRPRGVPKARLADMNLDTKISIFYRPNRNAPMSLLEMSFPKDPACIFCDRIHAEIQDGGRRSFIVTGGSIQAYRKIFAWILDCVQTQSIEKFPAIPEPDDDPFTMTLDVIVAGDHLGVPAGSLSHHLKKRLSGCARKHLMPFSQVRRYYDSNSEIYKLGLKEVACSSIFNAWWDARLDATINPELMEELYDMRQEIQELDDDLHKAFEVRKDEVEKKWAEKKARRLADKLQGSGNRPTESTHNDNDYAYQAKEDRYDDSTGGAAGGYDAFGNSNITTTVSDTPDWNKENVESTNEALSQWDKPTVTISDEQTMSNPDNSSFDNWADEMNETIHPAPSVPASTQW